MIIIRYRMNRDIDVYFQNMIIFLKEQRIKVLKKEALYALMSLDATGMGF